MSTGKIRRVDYSPAEFLEGVSNLNIAQIGMYWIVCSLIYARNEPVADDAHWIARAGGCTPPYARRLIDELVIVGKLGRDAQGRLTNGRAEKELGRAAKRVENARRASAASADARSTRAGRSPVSNRANDLQDRAGRNQQPATSNQQPSSSKREFTRERATPSGNGAGAVSRGTLIPDDWQPSDETVAKLRRSRPDLVGSYYDIELLKFRMWAAANAVLTHRIEASFIGFMIKAHLPPKQTEEERDAEFQRVLRSLKEKRQ
jgi:uncharacterized protein YdaU (DUF1376 family)